jgi:hypothetical protein
MEVALWGLVWFGGMVLAVNEFRRSADSLGAPPDVVSRLARRVSSGLGVFLVGIAAVAAAPLGVVLWAFVFDLVVWRPPRSCCSALAACSPRSSPPDDASSARSLPRLVSVAMP